ncbi:MAG: MFS transporter [Chloroflexi bacterium]|nr:MFS transporter [Chloroflexota bacterium]
MPPRRSASDRLNAAVRAPFGDVPGPFRTRRATSLDDQPTPEQDRGMRAFWWDGFWANIPETVLVNYLGLYIIAFGASTSQVGLLASLSSLFAALAFFPGARFVETFGHRKRVVVWSGGGLARVALFGLVFVPFVADGDAAVWMVIALVSLRGFAGYFAVPAWTSITADIVPLAMRGRFFASRSFGMTLAALATAPVAGLILDRFSGLAGWQIVWVVAFATGALSTWCFQQIPDPAPHADVVARERTADQRSVIADILADRNFVMYLAGSAVWNIALHASGPFFNIYLAENLQASALMIGILSALMAVTGLVGLVYFGRMMDVRGTKWLMVATGLLIPLLPAAWLFVSEPWHVVFINGPGGVLWAGYQLAMLNMVMIMAPAEKRARYAAAYQTVSFAGAFAGPLIGGQIIGMAGYKALFGFSAIGRITGTLIILRFVHTDDPTPGRRPLTA